MSSEPAELTELTGTDPSTGRTLRVRIENGRIAAIEPSAEPTDSWLSPGLVDLQVNGYAGHDVNATDAGPGTIAAMVHALFATGVTTVIPTVITSHEDQIVAALRRVRQARDADPLVAHAIPYVHVEGPHLSDQDGPRGVHPGEFIRPPDITEFRRWQSSCNNLVGMVTLSPHWPDSTMYIAELADHGIHVAIGHTHAEPEQITAAADAGASMSTHLGNGAHATIKRHPNYLWTQLADDRLTAGLIADGHHLPDDTLTVMLRAKGPDGAFLVSDAVALAGEAPGVYETPVGGRVELSATGRLSYLGTPLLAGAARPLSDGVAHVANLPGHDLADAVRLATRSPGRFAGGRGILRIGAPADLIRFRWLPGYESLVIEQVFVTGTAITPPRTQPYGLT